jgi:molybdate/tungstate transport system ATP-binding protein
MIDLKVKKKLGNFQLDCELKDAGVICLTGKNGSGKSSLLNIVAGIYPPDEGYVRINSEEITNFPQEKKRVVLVTPDSYIPNFEVDKHLLWGAKLRKWKISNDLVSEVKRSLGINYSGKVSKLSTGMKERVSLATALLSSPKAILVDETFANIDNRVEFIKSYKDLATRLAIDVMFATQHIENSEYADHHYNMDNGVATKKF